MSKFLKKEKKYYRNKIRNNWAVGFLITIKDKFFN